MLQELQKELGGCLTEEFVNGRLVQCLNVRINIDRLNLDENNPRIHVQLVGRTNISQQNLEDIIWELDDTKKLHRAILEDGGVSVPVIVQAKNDKLIVKEGNSRLTSCRKLARQFSQKENFKILPVKIFDTSVSDEEFRRILTSEHVFGKSEWSEYVQAKQIADMFNKDGKSHEQIANHNGLAEKEVTKIIDSLAMMDKYLQYDITCKDLDNKFAIILALVSRGKRNPIRDKMEKDKSFQIQFFDWLKTDKLNSPEQIIELPKVINDRSALAALNEENFNKARQILKQNDLSANNGLLSSIRTSIKRLETANRTAVKNLKHTDILLLKELIKNAQSILREAQNAVKEKSEYEEMMA